VPHEVTIERLGTRTEQTATARPGESVR
jgi:hypothetical protein